MQVEAVVQHSMQPLEVAEAQAGAVLVELALRVLQVQPTQAVAAVGLVDRLPVRQVVPVLLFYQ